MAVDQFRECSCEAVGSRADWNSRPLVEHIDRARPRRRKAAPPLATSVLSTVCRSKVERLITLSTSAVRGLLLQRLGQLAVRCLQLVEQPRVLDRDDGLVGERLHQLDLLVGERPHFLAVDGDHADRHRPRAASARRARSRSPPIAGAIADAAL